MFRMSCFENFRNREFLPLLQMRHTHTRAGGVPDVTVCLPWAVLTLLVPTATCGQLWKAGPPLLASCSSGWACPTLGTWVLLEFQGRLGPRSSSEEVVVVCTHLAFVGLSWRFSSVFCLIQPRNLFFPLLASYFFKSSSSSVFLTPPRMWKLLRIDDSVWVLLPLLSLSFFFM